MSVLLTFVAVLAGAFGLGWLLLACLAHERETAVGNPLEVILLSLTLGILTLGWVALILAEAGWFSLTTLIALWGGGVLILVGALRRRVLAVRVALIKVGQPEWAVLAVWLAVALYLFFRPHNFVTGGADAGVYVNLGSNIASSGSILIRDQALAELNPALYPALLRQLPDGQTPYYLFPAFYVPVEPTGLVIPQFYPLHPVWLAVFHGLGGLRANLVGTPFWALLGSLAVYLAARQMFGWKAALLSLGALTTNAMQVWFARYPTSEMLTQYLFWFGVYAFAAWISGRQPGRLWALVAGLCLGEVFLVRIDMYFLLAVPLLLGVWLRWGERRPGGYVWFFAPFFVLTVHSLVHGLAFSRPYFDELYQYGLRLVTRFLAIPVSLALVGIVGLVVMDRKPGWRRWVGGKWLAWRPILTTALVVMVVLLVVYGYWIRPQLGGPIATYSYWYGGGEIPANLDRENLVRLGWYLSPLGLVLAAVGVSLLLYKLNKETALFLGGGLFFSVLYIWRIQANPHQIYTMRRYVPVVMPFFVVVATYFLVWLYERRVLWLKLAGIALSVLWIVSLGWLARGFVSQVDYDGVVAQLDELDAQLTPHSVLIFDDQAPIGQGDLLGTPLRFLYGHDVFSLRRPELVVEGLLRRQVYKWQEEGRAVYWIDQSGDLSALDGLVLERQGSYRIAVTVLEGTYDVRPSRRIAVQWEGNIGHIVGSEGR